jgi:hypothetical protein
VDSGDEALPSVNVDKRKESEFLKHLNRPWIRTPKVDYIGFGSQMIGVRYGDLAIFKNPAVIVLQSLAAEDGGPNVHVGIIVLLKLGMTLTGFRHDDEDDKEIGVFLTGSQDKLIPTMNPFQV